MESPTKNNLESRERKDLIIESLTRQVSVVKELLQKADELSALSPQQAIDELVKIENGLLSKFPEETQQRYREILLMKEKLREIELAIKDIDDTGSDDEGLDDAQFELRNTLFDETKMIEQKVEALSDDQTNFIDATTSGIATLSKKAAELSKERTGDFSSESGQLGDKNLRFQKEDIIGTQTDAFSTVHIVEVSAWEKRVRASIRGFYVPGTSDIYVRKDLEPKRLEATIEHERTHNLLDGFETHQVVRPMDRLKSAVRRLGILKKAGAPDSLIKSLVEGLTNELYLQDLLNFTHNEFLAEYDEASRYSFKKESMDSWIRRIGAMSGQSTDIQSIDAEDATRSLATAGKHVSEVLAALKTLPDIMPKIGLPEYAEQVAGLKERFERMFLGMIINVRQQNNIARVLGSEAEKDVAALVHLLKPSKYGHIKTYLEETYGANKIETAERYSGLIFERRFSLDTLKEMVDGLKSDTFEPTEAIVQSLIDSPIDLDLESTLSMREYVEIRSLCIELHTLLSKKYPQIEIDVASLGEEVTNCFFSRLIKESIPDIITTLESLPPGFFTESEREGLKEIFEFTADPEDLTLIAHACSHQGITIDLK